MKSGPIACALQADAGDVAGGVLDADDVLQLEKPRHGLDRHVDHRARRDVVDDDRDADRVVDRLEVLVEPFLGRLVVVGRHDEERVGAGLLGMARELDRLGGDVRAGAGDTGTRPFASSMQISTTRLCSSWLSVGLSPVVPTGTRPWVPSSICQFDMRRGTPPRRRLPFANGVTRAVIEPRNGVVMGVSLCRSVGLQRRFAYSARHIRAAAVSAQTGLRRGTERLTVSGFGQGFGHRQSAPGTSVGEFHASSRRALPPALAALLPALALPAAAGPIPALADDRLPRRQVAPAAPPGSR